MGNFFDEDDENDQQDEREKKQGNSSNYNYNRNKSPKNESSNTYAGKEYEGAKNNSSSPTETLQTPEKGMARGNKGENGGTTANGTAAKGTTTEGGMAIEGGAVEGSATGGAAAASGEAAAGGGAAVGAPVVAIVIAIALALLLVMALFYAYSTSKSVQGTDDYVESMKENKEIIDTLFEKAYDNALSELEDTCKNKGYDWEQVKSTLNVDSWQDLYQNCNYGELIAVLSLGFENGKYGQADSDGNYDLANYKDFLYENENLEQLIYLKFESSETGHTVYKKYDGKPTNDVTLTDEQEAAYKTALKKYTDYLSGKTKEELNKPYRSDFYEVEDYVYEIKGTATLYPYCLHQIYDMIGLNPDEYYDENEQELTNTEMKDVILQQLEVFCEEDDELYESMNFDSETEWENDLYGTSLSETLESITSIDLGDFDTDEWYSSFSTNKDSSLVETYEGWLKMYSAPTCNSTVSTYYVNISKIKEDTFGYMASAAGNLKYSSASTSWCAYEFSSLKTLHGITWQNGPEGCGVYNDRYLVAVGPGIVFNQYYSTYAGVGNNAAWYDYGNKKMDLVLKNNETGNVTYVPITTGDAKGHAYPFGVFQTGIAMPSSLTAEMHGSDFKSDTAITNIGTANDPISTIGTYNTKLKAATGYDVSQWLIGGPIEWCCPGTSRSTASARISSLNSHFTLLGVIVY